MLSSLESRSQGRKCHATPLSSIEDIKRRLIPPSSSQNTNHDTGLNISTPSPGFARVKSENINDKFEEVKTAVRLEHYLDSSLLSMVVSKYAASKSILGKRNIVESFEWPTQQLQAMNSTETGGTEWQSCSEYNDSGLQYSKNYDAESPDFHTFDRITKLFRT